MKKYMYFLLIFACAVGIIMVAPLKNHFMAEAQTLGSGAMFWGQPSGWNGYGLQMAPFAWFPQTGITSYIPYYSQYGQSWGVQSFMPGYLGQYHYTPQSWSFPQRFSSGSSSQLPIYDDIDGVDFPDVAGWEHEGMWGTDYPWKAVYQYRYEPMEIGINKDEEGNLVQENTYRTLKESQYSKQNVSRAVVWYLHQY